MAIFDFGQTGGVQMTTVSFGFLNKLVIDKHTTTRLQWTSDQEQFTLTGTNLQTSVVAGHLTGVSGGVVTGLFDVFNFQGTSIRTSIYDLSLNAVTFYDLIVAREGKALIALMTAGNDEIHGATTDDLLSGGAGRDMILGMDGADTLLGGDNNDRLDGGAGADRLIGGKGADQFIFTTTPGTSVDTITDFRPGADSIELWRGFFANIGPLGAFGDRFEIGSEATSSATRVIYDAASGDLWYDRDGNGSRAAVVFAHLDAGLDLTGADVTLTN